MRHRGGGYPGGIPFAGPNPGVSGKTGGAFRSFSGGAAAPFPAGRWTGAHGRIGGENLPPGRADPSPSRFAPAQEADSPIAGVSIRQIELRVSATVVWRDGW